MKDWKAECEKLRGQLSELRQRNAYLESREQNRFDNGERIKNTFKELLIEILGSKN